MERWLRIPRDSNNNFSLWKEKERIMLTFAKIFGEYEYKSGY